MFEGLNPPPWPLLALWLLWLTLALWCWYNVATFRDRVRRHDKREQRRLGRMERRGPPPRAAVIVPVKGADEQLDRHIEALCGQNYPQYRLVFVVESEDDPACNAIRTGLNRRSENPNCDDIELLVAGHAERGGQKVHNLAYAVRRVRPDDQILVFADADAAAESGWLRSLILALWREDVSATTGYRWLLPDTAAEHDMPTRLASVINASVASLLGPPQRSQAWGGSMAVPKHVAERVKLLEHWDGAISDDYQFTRALRRAGHTIRFVPRLLLPSPVSFSWRSLLEFGRRQYLITRFHAPFIWTVALLATGAYTAGWISAVVAAATLTTGWVWGLLVWALVWLADLGRASQRHRLVRDVLGDPTARRLSGVFTLERWATPLWMGLHFLLVLSSAFGRRITWAGVTYELRGRRDVRILDRRDSPGPERARTAH